MSIEQTGGYLYILQNKNNEGAIKFGRTMKTPHDSYKGYSRYNPNVLFLRESYYFDNATKGDIDFMERKIKFDPIVQERKIRGDTSETVHFSPEILVYIDKLMFDLHSEWKIIQRGSLTQNQINIPVTTGLGNKSILPIRKHDCLEQAQNIEKDYIIKKLENSISTSHSRKFDNQSSPVQMTRLLDSLGIENKMANFKIVSYWLKSNSILPRRSNGKNVYDLGFC